MAFVSFALGQTIDVPFELGKPVTYGGIQVIPILSKEVAKPFETISLREAAKANLVRVSDSKAGASVWVENAAKVPLLILPGELLQGGHQDQMFQHVAVIPPGESANVASFCIEQGRGMGPTRLFTVTGHLAPDRLRSIALQATTRLITQRRAGDLIWQQVALINRSQEHPSLTGSLWATLSDQGTQDIVSNVITKLQAGWTDSNRIVGTMLCLNGRVYSADLLPSHQSFEAHRVDLFRMYALDSILEVPGPGNLDLDFCQSYLERMVGSERAVVGRENNTFLWRQSTLLAVEGSMIGVGSGAGVASSGFLHGLYMPSR